MASGISETDMTYFELYVCRRILNVYTKFQIDISKHEEKSPENFWKIKNAKIPE